MSKSLMLQVLDLLLRNRKRGVTTSQFLAVPGGYEFRSRISDLRKKGYNIICICEGVGSYRYFIN